MITHKELEDFLLEFDGAWLDYPLERILQSIKLDLKMKQAKIKCLH